MRSLQITLLLFCCVFLAAQETLAQGNFQIGSALLSQCKTWIRVSEEGGDVPEVVSQLRQGSVCEGYIAGAADSFNFVQQVKKPQLRRLCIPAGVTTLQLARVFVKYAEANPEKLHYNAAVLVFNAFVTDFACHANQSG